MPTPRAASAAELEKALVTSVPIGATPDGAAAHSCGRRRPAPSARCSSPPSRALAGGDFRAAASYARQASEADPKNADAHRILGDAALAAGQDADAEREFTAAIVLDSANAKAELGLGGRRRAPEEVEHRGEPLSPRPGARIPRASPPRAASAAR